jgi:Ca2+-binding RTX toxin-like protein
MIRLTKRRLVMLAACGLLIWGSFGALAAANTVDPSSADDLTLAFEPPEQEADCGTITGAGLVIGTNGPDLLFGGNSRDCVVGLGGPDILYGGNQSDIVLGGPGDDILFGDNSADHLDGGPGFDICYGGNSTDTFVNCEIWVQ